MKEKIIELIKLQSRIEVLKATDEEKKRIIESGSYAISEGYETDNMRIIAELEKQIEEIELLFPQSALEEIKVKIKK